MTERLFVYGTLAPGRPNEHVLAPLGDTWELVLTTPAMADHWTSLDEFEGPGYERVLAPVTLASREVVDAWLYVDVAVSP